jgi:spore germination cell wall hydrolase CwlJ-like protein
LRSLRLAGLGGLLAALLALAGCATDYRLLAGSGRAEATASLAGGFGDKALRRVTADMDPAMMAVAGRQSPVRTKDYWDRTPGWETYGLDKIPVLGVGVLSAEDARAINAMQAGSPDPPPPAKPFILKANAEDRAAAVRCLTQAVYYEAAIEPLEGQQAVAQTVLNRMRHPGYPKTVCGVVYQGSLRMTGCQFSFTCDGSLAREPNPAIWARAEGVATRALAGFVLPSVGTATHYHADYVAPYWAPTLYRITRIGRHIFYRWTGPWGLPPAFNGRYAGGEANLSRAILEGLDSRTQGAGLRPDQLQAAGQIAQATRTVVLSLDGATQSYTITVPGEAGQESVRQPGVLTPTRRAPTPEEVAEINAKLKAIEDDPDAPISTGPRAPPPKPAPTPTPAKAPPAQTPPNAPVPGDLPIGRRED